LDQPSIVPIIRGYREPSSLLTLVLMFRAMLSLLDRLESGAQRRRARRCAQYIS
jgi:hypothetical protein